jgi:hypothetical protein
VDCDLVRPTRPPHPQPNRDAILRFVTQPRSAGEIAEYIERPVPTTICHLRAMICLGLVRRIAFGTYAPGGYTDPKIRLPRRRSASTSALRAQLVALLHERASVQNLEQTTGMPAQMVRGALRDLWFSGLIAGNEKKGFWLVRWKKKNI